MEEFKGLNAISHHLLERISDKGDSPLRRFRARTDSLFDFDGGNSRLIAMQRVRRIFGLCSSIFIKNMAAIIERVYQVSKYEGREREKISGSGTWLALSARFSRQLLHFTFRTT